MTAINAEPPDNLGRSNLPVDLAARIRAEHQATAMAFACSPNTTIAAGKARKLAVEMLHHSSGETSTVSP
jgi:hypothetical protein